MDSRLRGNDAFLVAPAEAGAHASKQEWILACGGMTGKGGTIPQILTYCGQQLRKY